MGQDFWTDEKVARLRRLWDEGLAASVIAEALGGVSRGSVIGKANRLKLRPRPRGRFGARSHRAENERKAPETARVERIAAKPVAHKTARGTKQCGPDADGMRLLRSRAWTPLPGTVPVGLELRTGCRWPVDGPDGHILFCNAACDGSKYCAIHHRVSLPAERRVA